MLAQKHRADTSPPQPDVTEPDIGSLTTAAAAMSPAPVRRSTRTTADRHDNPHRLPRRPARPANDDVMPPAAAEPTRGPPPGTTVTRYGRLSKPPDRYTPEK